MTESITENNPPQILVVDDEQDFGEFVGEVANALNYRCKITSNAPDFMSSLHPDIQLIILDLVIPKVDGVEILRYLKQKDCKSKLILMSGFNKRVLEIAEDLAKELNLSVIGHVQKPIKKTELETVLLQAMAQPSAELKKKPFAKIQPTIDISKELIQKGLNNKEFFVYYQPQVGIAIKQVVGLEVLVRWQHPIHGFIMPDFFIEEAEKLGMIDQVSWYVIERAFKEMAPIIAKNEHAPTLSLNISPSTLINLKFPDMLLDFAKKYTMPENKITVEITESGLLKDLASALDILTRLRMKNINLSIDDFGTGYAMMQQLRRIPANEIKIDKSFIQEVNQQESARIMTLKIIEMGHALDMKVVAEGVETKEQLEFIQENHCDIVQGYYYSPPLPYQAVIDWVKNINPELFNT